MSSSKPSSSKSTQQQQPSEQEIVMQFNSMKSDLNSLSGKLQELEMEKDEHVLVIDSIKDLPPNRKCFRLVGGVLMERTVKDVVPALQTNFDGVALECGQVDGAKENERDVVDDESEGEERKVLRL